MGFVPVAPPHLDIWWASFFPELTRQLASLSNSLTLAAKGGKEEEESERKTHTRAGVLSSPPLGFVLSFAWLGGAGTSECADSRAALVSVATSGRTSLRGGEQVPFRGTLQLLLQPPRRTCEAVCVCTWRGQTGATSGSKVWQPPGTAQIFGSLGFSVAGGVGEWSLQTFRSTLKSFSASAPGYSSVCPSCFNPAIWGLPYTDCP